MDKIVKLILIFLFIGCGSTNLKQVDSDATPAGPDGVKGSVVVKEPQDMELLGKTPKTIKGFTNSSNVREIMDFLASDDLEGRESGTEGIEKAAQFIEGFFKNNRIKPYFVSYRDTLLNFEKPSYNIVGIVEGSDSKLKNEFIVIGAHYDHIGIKSPVNGDAIANGANDNAAGSTTALELARYFGTTKSNKRSLVFALFSAEEKGLLGSKHLARKLKEHGFDLYAMLNFEMVGVPLVGKDYVVYASGYERSNLAQVCNKYAKGKLVGFLPTAKEFSLFTRSDNYPFHKEFGVPSHTFSTFDFTNFNHYHKVSDEVSLMDFDHMTSLINKFIPVVEGIANSSEQEIKYN